MNAGGKLQKVLVADIGPNPHRRLENYPTEDERVADIADSIRDVGMFPGGIIVRPAPTSGPFKYEQAFGHCRIAAARRVGVESIWVIVKDLTDDQMLKHMVRENIEDQGGRAFLMRLETWEATREHLLRRGDGAEPTALDIGKFIGWDRQTRHTKRTLLTDPAYACNAAHELIESGIIDRSIFNGLQTGQCIELARNFAKRLRMIQSKVRNLTPEQQGSHKTELSMNAIKAAEALREKNIFISDGEAAEAVIRDTTKGKKGMPNFVKAVERERARVQKLSALSERRISAFCDADVITQIAESDREMLAWLRRDLMAAAAEFCSQAATIEQALSTLGDEQAIESVAREVQLLGAE